MLNVDKSISTKIGFAPQCSTTFAVDTHVKAGISTSSPGPMSIAFKITCRAVVQLVVAKLCFTSCCLENAASNSLTLGPCVIQPERMVFSNASYSSFPTVGVEI